MAYKLQKQQDGQTDIVIDGWEKGIASSPYQGIANIRNLNTSYYSGVAYVNYQRTLATIVGGTMTNPVQKATSPVGLNYILDDSGQIWKQSTVNSTIWNLLGNGTGRFTNGNGGLAYWNNYLVVFGHGVIEFCGDGSGDAGIISTNWNALIGTGLNTNTITAQTSPSVLLLGTSASYNLIPQVGDPVNFTTTTTLPAPLVVGTTYYVAYSSNNQIQLSTSYANISVALSGTVSSGATSATLLNVFGGITGSYTLVFSDGEIRTSTITNGSGALSWSVGLTNSVSATIAIAILFTSTGTGTHTLIDTSNPLPIGNYTNFQFTGGGVGSTSITITSYVNPTGKTVTGTWQGPSGQFYIIDANNDKIPAVFTNGSSQVNFISPILILSSGTYIIQFLDPTVTFYRPYISKSDGNLYFCNGRNIGRIFFDATFNLQFNPAFAESYLVKTNAVATNQPNDTVVDMVDLSGQLVFAGNFDIYIWDYISVQPNATRPVGEQIFSLVNLLNTIYIFAGQKGNIYVSNGYSAQLLLKLPDYIAGVIDPIVLWGGVMAHRSKLYFQALLKKS